MTVFPQPPKLEPVANTGGGEIRRLTEDHATYIYLPFGRSLEIIVKAGYETDGASVPSLESILSDLKMSKDFAKLLNKHFSCEIDINTIFKWLVGNPWDMPRLLAAVVHDGLYGRKWKCRWLCDLVYRLILMQTSYDAFRREIEYDAIRLFGWRNWNAVTKEERLKTKSLVSIRIVKTKQIPELAGISEEEN